MAAKRQPPGDKPEKRTYFVPAPVKKSAPESPPRKAERPKRTESKSVQPTPERNYFARKIPLPSELSEIWRGTGPELPAGYDGAEACPDCSAFKGQKHAQLCIRNPLGSLDITAAWQALRTKVQIFFGVGHPISDKDFDSYMTVDRQKKLRAASMVVMYDFPDSNSYVGRTLLSPGELHERAVIAEWTTRRAKR